MTEFFSTHQTDHSNNNIIPLQICDTKRSDGHSGCLSPIFSLLSTSGLREQKRKSRQIDKALAEDARLRTPITTVVLLGTSGSGKTTVFEHLNKILSPTGFDDYDRSLHVLHIKKKLTEILINCLEPPIKLTNLENEAAAKWLLNNAKSSILVEFHKRNFCLYREAFEKSSTLWKEPEIQRIIKEKKLPLNARHFLDKIETIAADGYLSTDEEILLWPNNVPYICPLREHWFPNHFRFIDVVYKPMKRVFLQRLSEHTSVTFMVDLSSYDRIGESLDLFENVLRAWQSQWSFVLVVFNKVDLIEEKIVSGEKLEDYFPDFLEFGCVSNDIKDQVVRVTKFIKFTFQKIAAAFEHQRRFCIRIYDKEICSLKEEDIKRLFSKYEDLLMIVRNTRHTNYYCLL